MTHPRAVPRATTPRTHVTYLTLSKHYLYLAAPSAVYARFALPLPLLLLFLLRPLLLLLLYPPKRALHNHHHVPSPNRVLHADMSLPGH